MTWSAVVVAPVTEDAGNKDCAAYKDFREALARKDIDAVLISTPDHLHCAMLVAAIKALVYEIFVVGPERYELANARPGVIDRFDAVVPSSTTGSSASCTCRLNHSSWPGSGAAPAPVVISSRVGPASKTFCVKPNV